MDSDFLDTLLDSLDVDVRYVEESREAEESIAHCLDHLTFDEVRQELQAADQWVHTFDGNPRNERRPAESTTEVIQEKPTTSCSTDLEKGKEIEDGDKAAGSIFMEFRCGTTCPRTSTQAGLVTEGILRLHSSSVAEIFCHCGRDGCQRDVPMTLNKFEEHGLMGGSKYWKRSIWVRIGGQQQSILDWDHKSNYLPFIDSEDMARMEFLVKNMPRRMKRQVGHHSTTP